eukprot:scaffold188472_cov27-Tisochrysis_lutea.AAC.2
MSSAVDQISTIASRGTTSQPGQLRPVMAHATPELIQPLRTKLKSQRCFPPSLPREQARARSPTKPPARNGTILSQSPVAPSPSIRLDVEA